MGGVKNITNSPQELYYTIEVLDARDILRNSWQYEPYNLPYNGISYFEAIVYGTDILCIGGFSLNDAKDIIMLESVVVIDTIHQSVYISGDISIPGAWMPPIIVYTYIYAFQGYFPGGSDGQDGTFFAGYQYHRI